MTISNSDFLKNLLAAGMPILWAAPQLDGDGNWLPEIFEEDGTAVPTGTWNGYQFPRWRDPEARELHTVRDPEHIDILLAKTPRPAFLGLTGFGLDVVDIDEKPNGEHVVTAEKASMVLAVPFPVALVNTPGGGIHIYVLSTGKHSESNTHTQIDYRGTGGLVALPGTLRRVNGEDVEYTAVSWTPEDARIPDEAVSLYDLHRAERRKCAICSAQQKSRAHGSSGVPMGDGSGWDVLEEKTLSIQIDDPLWAQASPWDLADATLTWTELLSPWFNVVGRRDSNLYLIRAGKAAEGRPGKSAVLHCADNKLVVYSSDLPIQTGTQLSKLDVYCAIREVSEPSEDMPEEFAERMKWLRERWAAVLYDQAGLEVPRYLRTKCADQAIARTPDYPVLPDAFWDTHDTLKRLRSAAEQRGASPEGTLACLLVRVLLNIGHQVVLPPKFGEDPNLGATLNVGAVLVAHFGRGKGEAEALADAYLSVKHMTADMASGQTFSLAFGRWVRQAPDPNNPAAPNRIFERNCWARYLQYDEMDRFKSQMGMQNSTLSPMLRTALTSDFISERFAINQDSRMPAIDGFRLAFVAHGQPERLDWLLIDEATGGFPQRLWYIYAESEMPSEYYLNPDNDPDPIEPLDLNLPNGWHLPDEIRPNPPRITVPLPRKAKEQVRKWQWTCEDGDQRGMLTVRLKAYAALMALLPDLSREALWDLATEFHSLSYRTHQHVLGQLRDAKVSRNRILTAAKAEEQRALSKMSAEDRLEAIKRAIRRRILSELESGPQSARQLAKFFEGEQAEHYQDTISQMLIDGQVIAVAKGFALK